MRQNLIAAGKMGHAETISWVRAPNHIGCEIWCAARRWGGESRPLIIPLGGWVARALGPILITPS